MGDFNCNLFNRALSENFRIMCQRIGLSTVHNSMPTHLDVRFGTTSLIDFFLVSNTSLVSNSGQFLCPFFNSHHSFIYLSYKVNPLLSSGFVEFKDYNKIDYDEFVSHVCQFDISSIFNTGDVDVQLEYFHLLINELHEKVPISRVNCRRKCIDFMKSRNVIHARSLRDLAFQAYYECASDLNWRVYCKYRNKAKASIRKERRKFGLRLFNTSDSKEIWRKLKNLGCVGEEGSPLDLIDVESLNDKFLDGFTPSRLNNFDFFGNNDNHESFSFRNVTEDELVLALTRIKTNATGHDMIPIKFIKLIYPLISNILYIIAHC